MAALLDNPDDPLCCCEYHESDGTRSHLLGLCCDCEALDKAVDRLVSGREVGHDTVGQIINVVEERIRYPWKHGAVRIPLGKMLPVVMLPSLLWLATLHQYMMLFTFLMFLPLILLMAMRIMIKHRPHTKFFLFWSYTSAAYLMYVYQVKLVGLFWDLPKVISWYENLVLVAGSAVSWWLYRKLQETRKRRVSNGKMCRICQVQVVDKDHHCVWLDMCIDYKNKKTFLMFLTITMMTSTHLALLLTSAACPGQLLGPVLLPEMCWPYSDHHQLLLVVGIYAGLVAGLLAILLIGKMHKICRKIPMTWSTPHHL